MKNFFKLLFLLQLLVMANNLWAISSAYARGSDDSWGWATRDNQAEANKVALNGCNKENPKKDCKLDDTKFMVRAVGDGRTGWGRSSIGLADAKKTALDYCGRKACQVDLVIDKPGFFSLAMSELNKDGKTAFFIAHQYDDSTEADAVALERCAEQAGIKCSIVMSGAIAGSHAVKATPPVAEKSCRPQTANIRCSSQCANGNCIVTYENGCKVRVQVQPRFDGINNQWTYPAPSC